MSLNSHAPIKSTRSMVEEGKMLAPGQVIRGRGTPFLTGAEQVLAPTRTEKNITTPIPGFMLAGA
ncbi:MAG: hypothetical protein DRO05_07090 [Thermoproteota archaeon]|nr:MAG: hypothetical protein DRO05_07090 [Candidatus Korarchaeota archaeon]